MSTPQSQDELASLQRQLDAARENLRLIEERKTEFALEVDVPLQLVKEERQWRKQIAQLENTIAALSTDGLHGKAESGPIASPNMSFGVMFVLGVLGFIAGVLGNLLAAVILEDAPRAFTLPRVAAILLLTAASIGGQIWIPRWRPRYDRKLLAAVLIAGVGLAAFILFRTVPADHFRYQVRVEVKGTNKYLPNAKVTLELGGKAPLDGVTDSNGLAIVFIPSEYAGQPAVLIVEAEGYQRYRLNIDLVEAHLPQVIQLEPVHSQNSRQTAWVKLSSAGP